MTLACQTLVFDHLVAAGIRVIRSGDITSKEIDEQKLIDKHYYALGSKATMLKPEDCVADAEKFLAKYGMSWDEAVAKGLVFNAADACTEFGFDALGLEKAWRESEKADRMVKLGGGFYCSQLAVPDRPPFFVLNGFFMVMRSKFTVPGRSIRYYVAEWDAMHLSWADFRGQTIGATDPRMALPTSLRGVMFARWRELGLERAPAMSDNCIHASASAFEALAERCNWLGTPLEEDSLGSRLLSAGLSAEWFEEARRDPLVPLKGGGMGSLFDALEDTGSDECLEIILQLRGL